MSTDSESVSDHDPYEGTHTDSDEDYLPHIDREHNPRNDNSPNSSGEVEREHQSASDTPQTGKKRLTRRALWKRTIQKNKRIKGVPYVNVIGIRKAGRKMGNNCNCKLKCFDDIGNPGCTDIFRNFYEMSSKDLQDAYLYGLITKTVVQRQRPRSGDGRGKNSSFIYKVIHNILFSTK